MTKAITAGQRLRIYIGESDRWHDQALYVAIVQEARRRGLAGATVARGLMGYGAASAIRHPHAFHLSSDLPMVIEIIDSATNVQSFLPFLDEVVREGLVTIGDVEMVSFRKQ